MADSPASPPNLQIWKRLTGLAGKAGLRDDWYLISLGAAIGAVAAFGAIGFKKLLDVTTDGTFSLMRDLPLWLLPVLPMVGARDGHSDLLPRARGTRARCA
ncbi:MAG: hypothetical protein ACFHWZ_17635 [Phycisphaerales bacterium]